jgi:hypothetical protein
VSLRWAGALRQPRGDVLGEGRFGNASIALANSASGAELLAAVEDDQVPPFRCQRQAALRGRGIGRIS